MALRVLIFLIISGGAHFLAARFILSAFPKARPHRRRIFIIAASLSFMLALLRMVGWALPSPFMHDVLALAMVELAIIILTLPWLGFFVLLSRLTTRAVAIAKPPANDEVKQARIGRREAIERVAGVSISGTTTIALGWGFVRGRHAFEIEEVAVKIVGWPRALDGYVIAQVSDIHVGAFTGDRELDEGFELVRRLKPDLVVATGDLVDAQADAIGPLIARLAGVGARDGAHAILGNHDHYAGADEIVAALRASKVNILDNQNVRIRPEDGGGFALLGVDDLQGRVGWSTNHHGPDLGRALANLPPAPDLPRILLAHQPRFFVEGQGRVALQLSGHTHGGQINPGFRPASAFMEFVAGRYERAGSTLWVNRGFGVVGPPARIGSAPEVTKLVIVAA